MEYTGSCGSKEQRGLNAIEHRPDCHPALIKFEERCGGTCLYCDGSLKELAMPTV